MTLKKLHFTLVLTILLIFLTGEFFENSILFPLVSWIGGIFIFVSIPFYINLWLEDQKRLSNYRKANEPPPIKNKSWSEYKDQMDKEKEN